MIKAVKKKEREMKEKHVTESKERVCVAYLIACSTDGNVLSVCLATSPKHSQKPP